VNNWERVCTEGLSPGFLILGLLKIAGWSEMCDVLSGGVPGCVTKCDMGGGSKLAKNSVTYFMDGPLLDYNYHYPLMHTYRPTVIRNK